MPKILIVDPNPSSLSQLMSKLDKTHLEPQIVTSLCQCDIELNTNTYDVVLISEDQNGESGAEYVGQNWKTRPVAFIMYTPDYDAAYDRKAQMLGASYLIVVDNDSPDTISRIISYAKSSQETLQLFKFKINIDKLTGLKTRDYFCDRLPEAIEESKRHGTPLCLAVADIDNFKQVNDLYGHLTGDDVICKLALIMNEQTRSYQSASRWGSDEIALIFPHSTLEDTISAMSRIQVLFSNEFDFDVSISVGIAELNPSLGPSELFDKADQALLIAKQRGKNRIQS